MSLYKELRGVDLSKIDTIFDDILGSTTGDQESDEAFVAAEHDLAYSHYPVFDQIRSRFEESIPSMESEGIGRQRVVDMLAGMDILATLLSVYASSETPSSPDEM